jgi:hypothetical protein
MENFLDSECDRTMFRCENGPCIPNYLRCNGRVECPYDSSDELDCPTCKSRVWKRSFGNFELFLPWLIPLKLEHEIAVHIFTTKNNFYLIENGGI